MPIGYKKCWDNYLKFATSQMGRVYSGLGSNETQEESSLSICLKKCLDKYLKLYISQTEWMDSEPQPGLEPESLGSNPEVEFELTVYLLHHGVSKGVVRSILHLSSTSNTVVLLMRDLGIIPKKKCHIMSKKLAECVYTTYYISKDFKQYSSDCVALWYY